MTIEEFKLPDVGEGVAEGELVRWLVAPGDRVEEDQPVAEVETDKALVEVPSRYDGVVAELFADPGEIVPVGNVIISFRVDENGDSGGEADKTDGETDATDAKDAKGAKDARDVKETTDATEPKTPDEQIDDGKRKSAVSKRNTGRTFAPPSARRLARELEVDLEALDGSGTGGRISEADVRAAASAEEGADAADAEDTATAEDVAGADYVDGTDETTKPTDASSPETQTPQQTDREMTLATPATRKLARELGVNLDAIPTDVTRDGEAFVDEAAVRASADRPPASAGQQALRDTETATGSAANARATDSPEATPSDTIPYRGVRRTIGKRMEQSKFTAPHVTHHDTVEVDALVEARERLKPAASAEGVSLTYMPFVMKAVVAGLQTYPVLNSELREADEEIRIKREYHLGIAVATDAGLMVPVVKDVDKKGLFELATEVSDLATRARERTLAPAELRGSTFTITNFGAIGGEYATPIINYPETAILGLGAIKERPVVRAQNDVSGEDTDRDTATDVNQQSASTVVPAPTLPLSLSIDHRVVDGAVAARFANTVMDHLETPLLLLTK